MKRKIAIMAIVLALLAALGAAEHLLVTQTTNAALASTEAIMAQIAQGRLDEAKEKAHALDRAWDERAKGLELLVDHSSTDEVRYALSRLLAALEGGDRAGALIYAGELEGAIEHVLERQAVTPENIL